MNSISEHKGRQELYTKQSPQVLQSLTEMSIVESAESSNRIEGITVDRSRLKPLVIGHSKPRDRSEEEVAGYRKALDLIHKDHSSIMITPGFIKELHRLCRGEIWDAGKWKEKDNDIIRKYPNGRIKVIFKPVSAIETPEMISQLCLAYRNSNTQLKYPDLFAIACMVLDFLCIHPFRDGNGRVSRLLTLLALYQNGYDVGKYISLERIIEQSKETYYEALNKSSQKWHQANHDFFPWFNYLLGTLVCAYKEFEERAAKFKPERGIKTDIIKTAVNRKFGEFSISDIEKACPSVSRVLIKKVLLNMKNEKCIRCLGKGQSAKWKKTHENPNHGRTDPRED
ncbi:MAG: Fic family protein [Victivallales bacterium]